MELNAIEQINKFKEFIDENFKAELSQASGFISISFTKLSEWDPDLATELLDEPEETIKAVEKAIEQFDIDKRINVRFIGLPATQQRNVWEVRKEDVGKFIALVGIINKSSSIIHRCSSARFECPVCGNIMNVLQMEGVLKEPSGCACGRKGKMTQIDREFEDIIKIGMIDDLMDKENVDRSIAREKMAILSKGLTSFDIDQKIKPGKKVILNGYFKYLQKSNSVEFDSIFQVNSIEFVQVGWDTVKVSKAEEKKILELVKQKDIISRLAESIADVEGFPEVKIASLLLLAGAPHIYDENGHLASRGTIHELLVSDPGAAKTYFIKRAGAISPIFSFQSAATSSGRGLVASVVQEKDKDIGTWAIYPGIVAMTSEGVAGIDEIDKTHKDDYGDHNNAMNDMLVPIAKANVKGKLETKTSYLATANPKDRIFTSYDIYYNQIDMPKDFIDRFDIIFPMIPPKGKESKDRIMDIMLERHTDCKDKKIWKPEFTHDFIRKYIAYCRQHNPNPKISKELFSTIKQNLNELMKPKEDEQVRISFRQLESIMRFTYASARLILRDVAQEDIDLAFRLKNKSFRDLGILSESGIFNWAKEEGIDVKAVSTKELIHSVLKEAMPDTHTLADWQEIIRNCKEKGVDEDTAEEHIQKLITKGDYYEPRRGFLQRIP